MGLFGSIGKAIGGAAKVVTKPIAVVTKPLAGVAKKAALTATKGTPLADSVKKITSIDFGKNPIKGVFSAVKYNYEGAFSLGKSLVAAKVGGAINNAAGSAMKGTPLEGTDVGNALQNEISSVTNKMIKGNVSKQAAKEIRAAGGNIRGADGNPASNPFGMLLSSSTDPTWSAFAERADTMGGVFGGYHS